jgi:hypothetical protein
MSATTIDRDDPCRCGSLAARRLADGALECPRCGRVEKSRWQVAHE